MCHDSSQASERPLVCETLHVATSAAANGKFIFFAVMADPCYLDPSPRSPFRCIIAAEIGKKVKNYMTDFDGILARASWSVYCNPLNRLVFRRLMTFLENLSGERQTVVVSSFCICIFRASASESPRTYPRRGGVSAALWPKRHRLAF